MHLKSLSESQDGRPSSSWGGAIPSWNLSHISFSDFSGEIMTYFRERDVITRGFPAKIGETPRKSRFRPISSRNLHAENWTEWYDTCFVQKLQLKPLPTPLLPPLPHPLTPPPFPNPSCPHPLAPFCKPFPQQFGPPPPKVNQRLKIVNYFTCMRHLFCRW